MATPNYLLKLLLVFFLSALLWRCGSDSQNRILVWTTLRPVERELLREKLQEFGKRYPEYRFQELYYQTEELRTNFMVSALAEKGPALLHCASDNIGPLAELGVVQPLEEFFSDATLDSFLSEPFPANTPFQGHLYQIADRVGNHLALVYNKKIVATPPETIAGLIEQGQKIALDNDGDGETDRYALAWNFIEPYFVVPFIGLYGGWILDENNNPTLDTEATVKAAQLIYDMANKYKIIPKECDYETANALFLDGKSAMIINGPWSWGTYIKRGMDIGLARIPRNEKTGQWATPIVSPMGYMMNINLTGKKRDIALELLKYLTSPGVELDFAREFTLIPSRKDLTHHPDLVSDPLYRAAYDQMLVGKPMPVVTELRWIWDAMRPAYQGIFNGRYTPEEAAKEMQRLAEKLIRENRE